MIAECGMRNAESPKKGSREKMLAALWATANSHEIPEARVYQICSSEVGRILVPGFGLTTCDHRELVRCVDAVKREAGELPSLAKTPRAQRTKLPRRSDGATRASLEQYRLMENLKLELRLSEEEFRGIAVQATQKEHSTSARDIGRIIEALKAIKRRRQRAAGSRNL